MDRLWEQASLLHPDRLPAWLTLVDISDYRQISSPRWGVLSPGEREAYFAELAVLKEIGLIVEEDAADPGIHQVYMAAPPRQEIWSIGMYAGASPLDLVPLPGAVNPVLTRDDVTDVPATYVADPFMLRVAGTWQLFFEVMNWQTWKGEIGLASSADGCRWRYQQIVLAEPFHLSYPYVFAWQGEFYLIPESFQAGAVRLYRASQFPTRWEFAGNLLEAPYLADPSIFRYGARWWLFVDASSNGRHDTLRLFSADELMGPWREHPKSPIVEGNPHHARPAGRVVVQGARVIRYAQNCSPLYGIDVRAFEVTELTATDYRECPGNPHPLLGPSGAGWNAGGMHHVDPHCLEEGSWIACVDGWFLPEIRAPGSSG